MWTKLDIELKLIGLFNLLMDEGLKAEPFIHNLETSL